MWANDYKVSVYGRAAAVQQFGEKLRRENSLKDLLWTLYGVRLVCHCFPSQSCHGDEIVRELPAAFDREEEGGDLPEAAVLDNLSRLREVPMSDTESSADEDVPTGRAGWIGTGPGRRQPEETRSRGWASRSCTEDTVWGSQLAERSGSSDEQGKRRADQS